jgi:hypothetical protein
MASYDPARDCSVVRAWCCAAHVTVCGSDQEHLRVHIDLGETYAVEATTDEGAMRQLSTYLHDHGIDSSAFPQKRLAPGATALVYEDIAAQICRDTAAMQDNADTWGRGRLPMSDAPATDILASIWQQTLHIIDDALKAVEDKHLSFAEVAELGKHGVDLVSTILRLVQQTDAAVRTDLRAQVQSARDETS